MGIFVLFDDFKRVTETGYKGGFDDENSKKMHDMAAGSGNVVNDKSEV